jgi:hypothetical protein
MINPFITIIGSEWADPLGDLAYAFEQRLIHQKHIFHLTPSYRGSCCSIIVMLVLMLESFTIRAEFDDENSTLEQKAIFEAAKWWEKSDYEDKQNILDAFVIRNSLVHNHLYSYGGDSDFISHLNGGSKSDRKRTENGVLIHSGLSCDPSTVGPQEVLFISNAVQNGLRFLKYKSANVGVVEFYFAGRGAHKSLWDTIYSAATLAIAKIDLKNS